MPAPDPWAVLERPEEVSGGLGVIPHRGSYNGWEFGDGTSWPIARSDGVLDMMPLKVQDAQLVGDGEVFGWDSETKRVITLEFAAGLAEMAAHCRNEGLGIGQDVLIGPRCAMMRRHDDLPLRLDDWVIEARPRRFLAPQRRGEATTVVASWEAQDPAIYRFETGPDTIDGWRVGTAMVGISEWNRPYPRPSGAEGITPNAWPPWAGWRYQGRGSGGMLAVVNSGCREIWLRARIQGPVVSPMLINQRTYELVEFDIELGDQDWLDVDFRTGTVMLNGSSSRYWTITRDSTWFSCGPGTTYIRYLSRGTVTESVVTAWWRSAW